MYQEFFRVSTLYRVGEGELRENFKKDATTVPMTFVQASVFQSLGSAIDRINLYPVNSAICLPNTYPLDSDLSGG